VGGGVLGSMAFAETTSSRHPIQVRWPTVLDSDHRYVELNVIRDPSVLVGWSDLFWFAGYHCISTHRFVTGYCSQSRWSWYAHACPPPPHKTSVGPRAQILVGVLRHYIVTLLQTPPKKLTRAAIREQ